MRKVFDVAATNAGVERWFPYLRRHTAVPLLLHAGKSIEVIADLLGDDPRTVYRDRPGR
jgi:site-specific recombinase XerD